MFDIVSRGTHCVCYDTGLIESHMSCCGRPNFLPSNTQNSISV